MSYYLAVLKKYAVFSGRARRAEYWYFILFNIIISFMFSLIDGVIGTRDAQSGCGMLSGLYALAVLVPGTAVAVRRLHDIGRSGWMLLIVFIPLIGSLWLLILMVTDSNPGENQYGLNPKGSETD